MIAETYIGLGLIKVFMTVQPILYFYNNCREDKDLTAGFNAVVTGRPRGLYVSFYVA